MSVLTVVAAITEPLSPTASWALLIAVLTVGLTPVYLACLWAERRWADRCTAGCCCPTHDDDIALTYDEAPARLHSTGGSSSSTLEGKLN